MRKNKEEKTIGIPRDPTYRELAEAILKLPKEAQDQDILIIDSPYMSHGDKYIWRLSVQWSGEYPKPPTYYVTLRRGG